MAKLLHIWGGEKYELRKLEIFDDNRVGCFGGENVYEGVFGEYCTYDEFLAGALDHSVVHWFGQSVLNQARKMVQEIIVTTASAEVTLEEAEKPNPSLSISPKPFPLEAPTEISGYPLWQSREGRYE